MESERMEHENYGRGLSGTALGLGIGGAATGVTALMTEIIKGKNNSRNNCMGDLSGIALGAMLGNSLGGGKPVMGGGNYVTQEEAALSAHIAQLESDNKLLQADKYVDGKLLEVYNTLNSQINAINVQLGSQAVTNQAIKDSFSALEDRISCCKGDLADAIKREADERRGNDNLIITYSNATFYPKQVADVTVGTTTTAQTTYNPLPVCGC